MTSFRATIDAAVAVLLREDDTVLLGERPPGKSWAGWWEFPGGKIEEGETPVQGLQRELQEELGTTATEVYPWLTRSFDYPERRMRLHFFIVRKWAPEPHGREGQQLAWQDMHALTVAPVLPANEPIFDALKLPSIYAITNLAEAGQEVFFRQLKAALEQGLRLIQVREKQLSAQALRAFAAQVIAMARPYGARILINQDIALARELDADGVHLPASELMALSLKPEGLLCAASCHDSGELAQAEKLALDFAVLSPVLSTMSHPDTQPLGWQQFSAMAMDRSIPVYALGGLSASDVITAWQNGAHGIAMQRAVWESGSY